MTSPILKKLKTIDKNLYPKIYCKLNCWKFSDELIEFKPKDWESLSMFFKDKIITEAINYIKHIIPEKKLSREWNKDRMNDVEFEIWWKNKKPLSEKQEEILKSLYNDEVNILKN